APPRPAGRRQPLGLWPLRQGPTSSRWSRGWSSGWRTTSRRPWTIVIGQSGREFVLRRAAERDRPTQERPEGAEDLSLQQGLGGARGDDVPDAVQLQLLLVCADAPYQG